MFEVSGCRITPEQMKRWTDTFLPEQEPFYVNDEQLLNELKTLNVPVYSRSHFSAIASDFIGDYGGNYRHWNVPGSASIAFLKAIDLEEEVRSKLFSHQVALGRGQVYTYKWVEDIDVDTFTILKESHDAGDGRIILTHDAWIRMPEKVKQIWLLKWLRERVESTAMEVEFGAIPEHSKRVINRYVFTFPSKSGANCFSAALGAYLGSNHLVENWLNTEPFFEFLKHEGLAKYEVITLTRNIGFRPHDVLVWENARGDAVHAAYAVSEKYCFNKMGQFWFQPWQFVNIEHILDYAGCLTNGGRICIYRSN
jgi:hypothetical protein